MRRAGFIYLDDILLLGYLKKQAEKDLKTLLQDLADSGMVINKKRLLGTHSKSMSFGVSTEFERRTYWSTSGETKDNKKGVGKNSVQSKNEFQKDGFNSGGLRSFLAGMPF